MKEVLEVLESAPGSFAEIERALAKKGISLPRLQSVLDGLVLTSRLNLIPSKGQWKYNLPKKPKKQPFKLTENMPEVEAKPQYNLQEAILSVLSHDAPSTVKILHRVTCRLHLRPFDLSFSVIRSTLYQMQEAGLVKYMAPTETTEGGWYAPRKPKAKK